MNNSRKTIGALGGTFDHFHKGHGHFLEFAAKQADQILIGVTNQSLIREKELSSIIEPYEIRTESVRKFCEEKKINFEIVELTDPFGPTLGQRDVDTLIITELTQTGGEMLNLRRTELGLPVLPIAVCSMLRDQAGEILNSTRIRKGLVNREGVVYSKIFDKNYVLQEFQKEFFKNPLGELVQTPTEVDSETLVAAVGDVCLTHFIQQNWTYQLGIFDKLSQRKPVTNPEILTLTVDAQTTNPAGTIQSQTIQALRELLMLFEIIGHSHPKHLFIDGEEDLVAVGLMMVAPLNSNIYYGQPDRGMVHVIVDEILKARLFQLFQQLS